MKTAAYQVVAAIKAIAETARFAIFRPAYWVVDAHTGARLNSKPFRRMFDARHRADLLNAMAGTRAVRAIAA